MKVIFSLSLSLSSSLPGVPVPWRRGHVCAAALRRAPAEELPAWREGGVQRLASPEILQGQSQPHTGEEI